jgi:hypothetical protein
VFGRPVLVGRSFHLTLLRRLRLPLTLALSLTLALALALARCRRLVLCDGRRRSQRHDCGNERCDSEFALHSVLSV